MSIKRFESRNSLKQKLKQRHLRFNESELDNVLLNHNYFNYFNGLETIFLESRNPKDFGNAKLKDFHNLYCFDKEFTNVLASCLDDIEEKLKASCSYHFCKIHCLSLNDTMQYTNKSNYMDPSNNVAGTPTYCRYSNSYPFKNAQNKKIYTEFDRFKLFRAEFLTDLIKYHDHIDASFYTDSNYVAPTGVAVYSNSRNVPQSHVAVPFWVSIETLTFGETLRLLHYLQDDVMEDVLKDFGLPLSKRNQFLNMIDFLNCLRNKCAHTTLINRFRTDKKYQVNIHLLNAFGLAPNNSSPASVLKLFDVIKITGYFTDVSPLRTPLRKLMVKNILSMGPIKGNQINRRILDRMGNSSYLSWCKMLSHCNYSL